MVLLCCFCFKMRKSLNDDSDSFDNDAYQIKTKAEVEKSYNDTIYRKSKASLGNQHSYSDRNANTNFSYKIPIQMNLMRRMKSFYMI
jgi:hypothetical protein